MIKEFFPLNFLATNCPPRQIGLRIEKLCGKNGNEKNKNLYFYNNFTMALKMGEPTSPLKKLKKLKSVHFENLRRVEDFSGLAGITSLRYLYINGTFDWKQPVENFEFLKDLPNLEVLKIYGIINKTQYPVFKSLINHKKLRKIKMAENTFHTKDYAFLVEALPNVEGIYKDFKIVFDYNPIGYLSKDDIRSKYTEEELKTKCPGIRVLADGRREYGDLDSKYYLFVGKGAGRVKCNNLKVEQKLAEFQKQYDHYKLEAKELIKSYCS